MRQVSSLVFALIRHGAHQIYPDHLTSVGKAAVLCLAERLKQAGDWSIIKASPRLRTHETAGVIGGALGVSVQVDDSLLETVDHDLWMPPHDIPAGTILVTHVPAIREIGMAWAQLFGLFELPRVDVAEGLLIDPATRTIKSISSL